LNSPKRLLARQQVQNQFDRAATTYDSVAWLQRKMGDALLKLLSDTDLAKDAPIIDLGCGTGELLRKLNATDYANLTGLDLSEKMLDVAKEKTPNATYLHADIESMPVDDESFVAVTSNAAIQWCDLLAAATEIHRVLQPGGSVFLTSFVSGTLAQWDDAFVSNGLESRVHPLLDRSDIETTFQRAGFYPASVETFKETNSFGSIEKMFASIKRLGASNAMSSRSKRMSRQECETLKRHFEAKLESKGRLELDFVWVQAVVRKD